LCLNSRRIAGSGANDLKVEEVVCSVDQAQRDKRDKDFADGSDSEGTPALLAEFAEAGAEAYSGESQ
jgi:hypothetical protein